MRSVPHGYLYARWSAYNGVSAVVLKGFYDHWLVAMTCLDSWRCVHHACCFEIYCKSGFWTLSVSHWSLVFALPYDCELIPCVLIVNSILISALLFQEGLRADNTREPTYCGRLSRMWWYHSMCAGFFTSEQLLVENRHLWYLLIFRMNLVSKYQLVALL